MVYTCTQHTYISSRYVWYVFVYASCMHLVHKYHVHEWTSNKHVCICTMTQPWHTTRHSMSCIYMFVSYEKRHVKQTCHVYTCHLFVPVWCTYDHRDVRVYHNSHKHTCKWILIYQINWVVCCWTDTHDCWTDTHVTCSHVYLSSSEFVDLYMSRVSVQQRTTLCIAYISYTHIYIIHR